MMRVFAWVAVILTTAAPLRAADVKPNVLLIVSDDHGYGDAGCYGKTDVETPNIDGLAKHGARFTRFRVNPLCGPTRASLLTGQYSLECGMWRGPSEKRSVEDGGRVLKN